MTVFEEFGFAQRMLTRLSRLSLSRSVAIMLAGAAVLSGVATYLTMTRESTQINTLYWLLNLDMVLLLLLGTVVARQVVRLWGERRKGVAGSRLHVRLVFVFSVLAAAPAILMAIFSAIFIYFGIHAWFNERVSTAVNESMEVAQAYLKEHQQVMRADVLAMASDLNRESSELIDNTALFSQVMQTQSMLRNLPEAIVFRSDGKVLARSRLSFSLELDRFSTRDMDRARGGDVVLMTGGDHDRIRALVRLEGFLDGYLYVGRLVDASVLAHMQTTEKAVREYTTLEGRQSQIQISMTLMFMAVALLLLLTAIWFGLSFAERLVSPISGLIAAAEKVRAGNLSARVRESAGDDEIGILERAFNRMTRQIESQQDELIRANRIMDERRRFTEAVLSGASSGIVGLEQDGTITLANARAVELLLGEGVDAELAGRQLADFIPDVRQMMAVVLSEGEKAPPLQTEYAVGDGPLKSIMVRITAEQDGLHAIATIDDVSMLVSAQRKAAWADVARRIAHEIKNPLTPIQLSAERLKRRYLPQIQDDPETFEKCTETIIRQVNEIGHMVTEFSAYARMPMPVKRVENVVEVCQDALVLQRQAHVDIGFGFISAAPDIRANIDRSQLTQVITNLLQNAIDSIHERQLQKPGEGRVKIVIGKKGDNISISVEDNGLGLPEKSKAQLFEPYVTTKKKGSGLGLAIVRKIMEDHDGSIILEDNASADTGTGAKAVIVFPENI